MATTFLSLVNGIGRGAYLDTIYDQNLTVVSGTAANSNEVQGPVTSGTSVTLPQSGTYLAVELQIELNGQGLEPVTDYTYVGSGTRTQVQFTFGLVINDVVNFRKVRSS